jgi:putative spermidine/putrescine transport system ATP-binding protein
VEAAGTRVAAMVPASLPAPAEGEMVVLSFLPQDLHQMDGVR